MKSLTWGLAASVWFGLSFEAAAQVQTASIPLTDSEEVFRIVSVTLKSGAATPRLIALDGFDPDGRILTFSVAGAGSLGLRAADIKRISFSREPKESSSFAQTAPWTIAIHPGKEFTAQVRAADLTIGLGHLLLANVQQPPATLDSEIEVNRIEYDRTRDRFTVRLQAVRYEKKFVGGGGRTDTSAGGGRPGGKPIQ